MKIDRVKYTAHYDEFGTLKDQWIGLEGQIDDAESPESKLDEIKAITERWYQKQNPFLQQQGPPVYDGNSFPGPRIIETKPEDREVGLTPELITSCEDMVTLETFFKLIKMSNRVDLSEAYDKRKEELRQKEIKEILTATDALKDKKLLEGYNKNTKAKH